MIAQRERVLRAVYAAFEVRDAGAMGALVGAQFEFHSATGSRLGRTHPYIGHDGLSEYFSDIGRLWNELRLSVVRFEHVGDEVLAEGRVWARNDEVVIDSPAGWIWTFQGPTPLSCRVFEDLAQARDEFAAG